MATKVLAPLEKLYDRTYGTDIKQPRRDKFIIMINGPSYGDGLKHTFDTIREVYGMKKLSSMPKTFLHFHAQAARMSSQYDQDGVIKAIFEAIQPKYKGNKFFV